MDCLPSSLMYDARQSDKYIHSSSLAQSATLKRAIARQMAISEYLGMVITDLTFETGFAICL